MQPEDNNMDDLEYLSRRGFELTATTREDIEELTKTIRARAFSYNSGMYFSWISLIVGVFIGISVFVIVYKAPPDRIKVEPVLMLEDNRFVGEEMSPTAILLDTVKVTNDNFVREKLNVSGSEHVRETGVISGAEDSIISIPSRDIDVSAALEEPVKEGKIKFIINAPVFYLHDLKITNYGSLYFKRNQFVRFDGTPANDASKVGSSMPGSHLKESADYFLHLEIADAMLYFKKRKYDQCIMSLNLISTYNKEDVNCDFYLGMCYYYKKNYRKAIEFLDNCIVNQNNTFLQEATWYKGLSLFESGETEKANILFSQIASEGEFYAEKAKIVLNAFKQ